MTIAQRDTIFYDLIIIIFSLLRNIFSHPMTKIVLFWLIIYHIKFLKMDQNGSKAFYQNPILLGIVWPKSPK